MCCGQKRKAAKQPSGASARQGRREAVQGPAPAAPPKRGQPPTSPPAGYVK